MNAYTRMESDKQFPWQRSKPLVHFHGLKVFSREQIEIGYVSEVYCDRKSHEMKYFVVSSPYKVLKKIIVPFDSAHWIGSDCIYVPYSKNELLHDKEFDAYRVIMRERSSLIKYSQVIDAGLQSVDREFAALEWSGNALARVAGYH